MTMADILNNPILANVILAPFLIWCCLLLNKFFKVMDTTLQANTAAMQKMADIAAKCEGANYESRTANNFQHHHNRRGDSSGRDMSSAKNSR
jgi:hypothetical protein